MDSEQFQLRLAEACATFVAESIDFGIIRARAPGHGLELDGLLDRLSRDEDPRVAVDADTRDVLVEDASPAILVKIVRRLLAGRDRGVPEPIIAWVCASEHGAVPEELLQRLEERTGTAAVSVLAIDEFHARLAESDISVLLLGETGSGKEVSAENLHRLSPRRDQPFLRLNCGAISESLLQSELFGHERGSFTGAFKTKLGLLEAAQGGSIFLDEVGELPLSIQASLLRVIDERKVLPVGGLEARPIDVRFISATHRDLREQISAGAFREDLYFRLNGFSLFIRPLRERIAEIGPLARRFIQEGSADGEPPELAATALQRLEAYGWPGNIRELRNVMQRAVLLAGSGREITVQHLVLESSTSDPLPAVTMVPIEVPPMLEGGLQEEVRRSTEEVERRRILEALDRCAGNQTEAAKVLGLSRRTLVNRLETLGLPRPRKAKRKRDGGSPPPG